MSKEVTVKDLGLYGSKQAVSSNLLTRFLIKSPPLGLFTDSSGLSCGGLDPVFLQAFLLSAVPSFLHNCQSWTLAFHFIFIWLLPQLPIFEHFAYYQSGSSCTLLSSILLIGSSVGPTFPKTVNSPRTQSLPRIQHSPQAPRAGATFPLRKVLASLTEWVWDSDRYMIVSHIGSSQPRKHVPWQALKVVGQIGFTTRHPFSLLLLSTAFPVISLYCTPPWEAPNFK